MAMACCSSGFKWKARPGILVSASMAQGTKSSNIKVIVTGACKDVGKAAIAAITKARGMEVAGAIDRARVGEDAGEVSGLEALDVPISSNLVAVLGSLSQSRPTGVVVDFSDASEVLETVRQATAFGMRSVVAVQGVDLDVVSQLMTFCEKASMEAAIAASFHYSHVDVLESHQSSQDAYPSPEALRVAKSLSGLGRVYNDSDFSKEHAARGEVADDAVRIHSMVSPAHLSSLAVNFAGPGEALTLRHDITNVKALMPGLLVAIRRVVKLQSLVYGLEKIL